MCQPKVGRSGLGGYGWFGCCGSHSDGGPQRMLLFMIGLSVRTFLLHYVNFCLHGCYFALGLSQLVCSIQRVLLGSQLLGEDIFLFFQGLKLEAHDGELILVGP